jgi:HlyD family secretion protein
MKKGYGRNTALEMRNMKDSTQIGKPWLKPVIAGAIGILLLIAAVRYFLPEDDWSSEAYTFAVRRGPLTISVLEAGTIKARDQVIIKNEVEGKTTILSLVKEGTMVKKGDLLIELDASRLQDEKIDQQIKVQNAEAAFIRARENLEVVKNQARSEKEKAELEAQFAKEDLVQYQEGEYPKDLKEANAKITLAREELQRAEEKVRWSSVLFKEQYISQSELEADQLSEQKTKLDLDLALADRDLLQNYTYKRKLTELQSNTKQTAMALERTRRKAAADIVQAEAEFRARESEFTRETAKLDKLNEQIAKTRITAPIDGLVVYATSAQSNWRGNTEPLAEGQEIREQQELIYLPATGSVMAEAKIHESNLDKVKIGLPVKVTVDAVPGRVFEGTVDTIAPLPDAVSVWLNPDLKLYASDILLQGDGTGLRTGMSCQVEIIVKQLDDVFYVPVQSVTRVDGVPTVYVGSGNRFSPRPVELGLDNNRMVRILNGLQFDEKILLNPPLAPDQKQKRQKEGNGASNPNGQPTNNERKSERGL